MVGAGKGYSRRVYLLYDGIHYDCAVYSLAPLTALEDFDIAQFRPTDAYIEAQCLQLLEQEHKVLIDPSAPLPLPLPP